MASVTPSGPRRRATAQGSAVRQTLAEHSGFLSAQDVYSILRSGGHRIGLSTVYRQLQALSDRGLADIVHNPEGEVTYRFCGDTGEGHHHHLVCRQCGRAEEIESRAVERWAEEVAEGFGYAQVDHTIEVFGVCADCMRAARSA